MAPEGLRKSLVTGKVKRVLLELHPDQLAQQGSSPLAEVGRLQRAGYRGYRFDHSKPATRAAAYAKKVNATVRLQPLGAKPLDSWPHQLWLAPGIKAR